MTDREFESVMVRDSLGSAPLRRFTDAVLASDDLVPVVLEFEQPPAAVYGRQNPQADLTAYQKSLEQAHEDFVAMLVGTGIKVEIGKSNVVEAGLNGSTTVSKTHNFTHVFNGIGVLIPGHMVAQVATMAGVRTVSLNRERVYLNLDKSVPFVGAPQIWERLDSAGRAIRGEEIKVAVIDTGVV
jgi:hypothetical protein